MSSPEFEPAAALVSGEATLALDRVDLESVRPPATRPEVAGEAAVCDESDHVAAVTPQVSQEKTIALSTDDLAQRPSPAPAGQDATSTLTSAELQRAVSTMRRSHRLGLGAADYRIRGSEHSDLARSQSIRRVRSDAVCRAPGRGARCGGEARAWHADTAARGGSGGVLGCRAAARTSGRGHDGRGPGRGPPPGRRPRGRRPTERNRLRRLGLARGPRFGPNRVRRQPSASRPPRIPRRRHSSRPVRPRRQSRSTI